MVFGARQTGGRESRVKAMVLPEFGESFKFMDREVPVPGPGEVLVRVRACGLGLTLEHARNGRLGGRTPTILGHEFAGTVSACGPGIERWAPDDRVTASFYLICGECERCADGRESLCTNNKGYLGVASDGAFAEFVLVPSRNLVRVPENVDLATAGVVADALATPYHVALHRAHIGAGTRVAVVGAGGGIGVHMVQMVRAFGGVPIAVERDPRKLDELRRRQLADVFVSSESLDWPNALARAADGRLDVCVDTVASNETLRGATEALGSGGVLVIVGFDTESVAAAPSSRLLQTEQSILGSRYASRAEIAAALDLVSLGRVVPVIGASYPLEQLNEAFEAVRAGNTFGRILIECAAG